MGYALQGNSTDQTQAVNTTRYSLIAIARNLTSAGADTEAYVANKCRAAATLRNLESLVSANTLSTATTTITSRKNSGAGSMSLSISAGLTGLFSDLVNSDSLAVADTYDLSTVVPNSGTGSILIRSTGANLVASNNHTSIFGGFSGSAGLSSDFYCQLSGDAENNASETTIKQQVDVAGTIKNMQVYLSVNSNANTMTVVSRVNGANGAQTISISAAATGLFEDTSNSDTLVAGDDICAFFDFGAGGTGITLKYVSTLFTNTVNKKNNIYTSSPASRTASATASYYSILGMLPSTNNTTESTVKIQHNFPVKSSLMKIYVSANTYTGTATMTSRKNGGAGSQTISITATTTGLLEDVTNSDTLATTDDFNFSIVNGTSGSITIAWIGSLEEDLTPTTSIKTYDGLAYASIKTFQGLAVASVKTFNGLA
jgi:hypothetical protein